ncbi:MAG: hypothetical protein A2402_02040 [Candidatus Staskawiczbacteria bacterium RIFOXYC1_FULL_37_43]|nr:MAG: hypothetical protein A2813_02230 [Candidatus Staskawiczbacteria bacterium RIFCSPHIGHO2_01_FULL_37_17]OGZ71273.1 MAG: hypothetical protein A2891_03355 [Candidatus Staskawiczbacteria bacterium RIFCSPLOWO2_01_FULL_37_19]OGZ75587.1 MAG: hypothetical protein A2205_00120 [Candidatus Staskawiczbacteria bacterium RIFOXYA1_FULL_37_15]OGZ77697.1 MAG: hypothetical protein A2280_03145 [Candidatus Staskawiczbacteria bacterium RIFOXYA12_FULL_37_10]OGZ79863.1 MAG: hypothetical protein A2353_01360 [Can
MEQGFKKLNWTQHSQIKMRQYGLSKQKLMGILRKPERKEKGIAPGTTAVMRTNKKFVNKNVALLKDDKNPPSSCRSRTSARQRTPGEIWIMYKDVKRNGAQERKIISAWRYPGVSKHGDEIPIPEDIRQELLLNNNNYDFN